MTRSQSLLRDAALVLLFLGGIGLVFAGGLPGDAPTESSDDDTFEVDGYVLNVSTVDHWQQLYFGRPTVAVRLSGRLHNATATVVVRGPDGGVVGTDRVGSEGPEHVVRTTTAHVPLDSDGLPATGTYTVSVRADPTGERLYRDTTTIRGLAANVTELDVSQHTYTVAWVERCDNVYGRTVYVNFTVENAGDLEAVYNATVSVNGTREWRGGIDLDAGETRRVSARLKHRPWDSGDERLPSGNRSITVEVSYANTTLSERQTSTFFRPLNANRTCRTRERR